jgi:phosphoenolpyruvate phosphomutase
MIIARLESLIAKNDLADALRRARAYLLAGVDAILIHSKSRTPDEIHAFADGYERLSAELGFRKPLCCIPTTYNRITDRELFARGFNLVIHANHLLRTAHHAMEAACEQILAHDRTYEVEDMCTPVAKLFDLVGS